MDYGEVISSAWRIIWKHKVLWLFGILGSCGGSTGSSSGSVNWQFSASPDFGLELANFPTDWRLSLIIGVGAVLIVALVVLVVFLSTIGRIGLTLGALRADQGEETLSFGDVFRSSTPYFWRVFFLNLLIVVSVFILIAIFGVFFLAASLLTLGLALLCLIPLLCVLVPISWLAFTYIEQANVSLIVEDLNIGAALRRGWDVFSGNLGSMIIIGLFVILIAFVSGFIFSLPITISLFPLFASLFAGEGTLGAAGIVAAVCIVLYLPILFILNGVIRSYLGSVWTLTYLRLTSEAPAGN
ncbi:MAG: hypothetical protein R3335_09255 [Anaerolineales bacterium]|nr:hypothetical protein [Anaerolineales bacterium]